MTTNEPHSITKPVATLPAESGDPRMCGTVPMEQDERESKHHRRGHVQQEHVQTVKARRAAQNGEGGNPRRCAIVRQQRVNGAQSE